MRISKLIESLTKHPPRVAKRDRLKGGLADTIDLSSFDKGDLSGGIEHELEHTEDASLAAEIAADHLAENPNYYDQLESAGLDEIIDEELSNMSEDRLSQRPLDKVTQTPKNDGFWWFKVEGGNMEPVRIKERQVYRFGSATPIPISRIRGQWVEPLSMPQSVWSENNNKKTRK